MERTGSRTLGDTKIYGYSNLLYKMAQCNECSRPSTSVDEKSMDAEGQLYIYNPISQLYFFFQHLYFKGPAII